MTSVSYISSMRLSNVNNLEKYWFLEDNPFVSFYRLAEDDVRKLFQKDMFKLMSGKSELAKIRYDRYVCKQRRHAYNTYSFLKFLKFGKIIAHGKKMASFQIF